MKICVIGGTGYVGLITGLGLAEMGHSVINVDINRDQVNKLQSGKSSILEPGLEPLVQKNLKRGSIQFTTDVCRGIAHGEAIFITVGTPSRQDGQADLSQVVQVAEDVLRYLDGYKIIVVKSTVPAGAVELIGGILGRGEREGTDFDIVANPEFLREGKGLYDFFYPDRIVIGTRSEKAKSIMRKLYEPIIARKVCWREEDNPKTREPVPLVETDIASAEMIKYASNAFLATRVSFINEIANLCERVGADIREVVQGMGYDPRIGPAYLEAGLGFGGPCLEKDLRALVNIAVNNNYEPRVLRAVLERNEQQVWEVIAKSKQLVGYLLYKKIIAVFGLAFKAGANDVRGSLALRLIEHLEQQGVVVQAHDPVAIPEAQAVKPHLACFENPYEAVRQAEALIIATNWPQFQGLDFELIKAQMARPCIVDGRNLLDGNALRQLGFSYTGIGVSCG